MKKNSGPQATNMLRLRKEPLRILTTDQLSRVRGGVPELINPSDEPPPGSGDDPGDVGDPNELVYGRLRIPVG